VSSGSSNVTSTTTQMASVLSSLSGSMREGSPQQAAPQGTKLDPFDGHEWCDGSHSLLLLTKYPTLQIIQDEKSEHINTTYVLPFFSLSVIAGHRYGGYWRVIRRQHVYHGGGCFFGHGCRMIISSSMMQQRSD